MKRLLFLFFLCLSCGYIQAQICRLGFTERFRYTTVGGGLVNGFKPGLIISACVQDKPGLGGQEVNWHVKILYHNYKVVRFIKYIKLTCGNVISKKVTLYNVKQDQSLSGSTFSGDADLGDDIFKEDCANPNR